MDNFCLQKRCATYILDGMEHLQTGKDKESTIHNVDAIDNMAKLQSGSELCYIIHCSICLYIYLNYCRRLAWSADLHSGTSILDW